MFLAETRNLSICNKNFNMKILIVGKHAIEEKERVKKRGMSKPGHAVIISGESTEPPYGDVPVDLSADHRDLVMEYSGSADINTK